MTDPTKPELTYIYARKANPGQSTTNTQQYNDIPGMQLSLRFEQERVVTISLLASDTWNKRPAQNTWFAIGIDEQVVNEFSGLYNSASMPGASGQRVPIYIEVTRKISVGVHTFEGKWKVGGGEAVIGEVAPATLKVVVHPVGTFVDS
jgi:hypothetical protein